jgi:hypothetical protein
MTIFSAKIQYLFNIVKQISLFLFITTKQIVFYGEIDVSCRPFSIKDEKY